MTFHLTINMDNAAFEDNAAEETANILLRLCRDLARDGFGNSEAESMEGCEGRLMDYNGNRVGRWEITK